MSNRRALYSLLALGLSGLAVLVVFYREANPSANIRLALSRAQVEARAADFLKGRALDISGTTRATIFGGDDMAAIFLQKTVGLGKTNALSDPEQAVYVPLWKWGVRFFRPQEKEEYQVSMTPNGKITRFEHVIPEEQAGANLEPAAAEMVALDFLARPLAVGFRPADWERVTASSEKLQARTDHYFTWKRKEPRFGRGDGDLRIRVTVAGDRVTSYSFFLKVPDEFERTYNLQSDAGNNLARVALFFTLGLFVLTVVYFMMLLRKGDMDYRIALGAAGMVGLAVFFAAVNSWPSALYSYSTDQLLVGLVLALVIGAVLGGAGLGGLMLVIVGVGSALLSRAEKLRLLAGLREISRGRLLTPALAQAVLYGYLIAFFFLGYDTALYAAMRHLGWVWLPAGNDYTEAYGSLVPALAPLAIGIMAGFWEEGFYRFASFAVLRKVIQWAPAAAVLPTMIWAFAHSNYPVFPVYFRGIELTVGGLLFFYFFWRFGYLTVAFAHFFIDTILIAIPLVQAPSPYFKISGIVAMGIGLIPLALGLLGRGRKVYLLPDVPRLDGDTSVGILRRGFETGALPAALIQQILREKGLADAPVEARALFLAREVFGLSMATQVDENRVTLRISGGAPKADVFRALLGIEPSMDGGDLLLSIPL